MKRIQYILFYIFCITLSMACKKTDYAELNKGDTPLSISSSVSSLTLKEKERDNEVLILNWTSGSNKGTNAAINYTLQIAKQGANFSGAAAEALGSAVYSRKYTSGQLNDLLLTKLKAIPGTAITIEARIVAATQAEGVEQEISEPVSFTVIPYQPVTSTLYLIGDATPNGWDNNNPTPMTPSAVLPGVFTWTGLLNPGDFKFLTTPGQWLPTYNKSANSADSLFYRTDFGQADDKFSVATMGTYTITVNLLDLTISIVVPTNPTVPPYDRLWIVGDATPNGWNIDSPNEMWVDQGNKFVFYYNEILAAGEFKIPTSTGNWGTDFYMPFVNHQDLTAMDVQLVKGGSPDNKWQITTPGAYKIKLDLYNTKITIKPFTPYNQLWLVGDATPTGWNIDNPTPMTKDPSDPYIFSWQGDLVAGEFKIPTTTGNFGCDYFMPMVNHQDITNHQAKFVPSGNPDNKWLITVPGTYKITLNQLKETIIIEKQ